MRDGEGARTHTRPAQEGPAREPPQGLSAPQRAAVLAKPGVRHRERGAGVGEVGGRGRREAGGGLRLALGGRLHSCANSAPADTIRKQQQSARHPAALCLVAKQSERSLGTRRRTNRKRDAINSSRDHRDREGKTRTRRLRAAVGHQPHARSSRAAASRVTGGRVSRGSLSLTRGTYVCGRSVTWAASWSTKET